MPRPIDFLRSTRAGATAFTAVLATIMTVGATTVLVEHKRLVDHRDVVKSAASAASVAATRELSSIPAEWTDTQVEQHLLSMSHKWAMLNVLASPYGTDLDPSDVDVSLQVDRTAGTVSVTVETDGHDMLMAKMFGVDQTGKRRSTSGAERVRDPVDVVLAIDMSGSMGHTMDGSRGDPADHRIEIVRRAASNLVDIVGAPASIALVPWTNYVNTDIIDWPDEWNDFLLSSMPATVPLTRNHERIRGALRDIQPRLGTMSTLGLFIANSYLRDGTNQFQALVLLTDGRDTRGCPGNRFCPNSERVQMKLEQCTLAKSRGALVFVVTAMTPELLRKSNEDELRACSSESEDPEGRYVFFENATADDLEAAFADIANQLQPLRRTY